MRISVAVVLLAVVPFALYGAAGATHRADGTIADAYELDLRGDPRAVIRARPRLFVSDSRAVDDLRLVAARYSLTGEHHHYQQFIGGLEVVGGGIVVRVSDGRVKAIHNRLARDVDIPRAHLDRSGALARLRRERPDISQQPLRGDHRVLLIDDAGELRVAHRFVVEVSPLQPYAFFVDLSSGDLIRAESLFFTAGEARVFVANPVTTLNNPNLTDGDDAVTAVPESAYTIVSLRDIQASGPLVGPHVQIVDSESPRTKAADSSASLIFDRSQDEFEDVMAYYHLDRSQRYMQSLGFIDSRRIIRRAIRVDAHAAGGADNSFYQPTIPGEGGLFFGDGGVDDAEDPDILFHEYGHAIQDAIAPGAFGGSSSSESRALGEGFGDFWAFSEGYAASLASGRDPFCIGDWDARCIPGSSTGCAYPSGSNCLRRVDGAKTMDDWIGSDQRGVEHRNGEIWSVALQEIFTAIVARDGREEGKRNADRLILEAHFGMPPLPKYKTAARKLLEADRFLYAGKNASIICDSMTRRKIFSPGDCTAIPRGEYTLFQTLSRNVAIPDANGTGISLTRTITDTRIVERVQVRVEITHPSRGDLRLTLIGPNGKSVVLQATSADISADLRTTYGFDTEPAESLAAFAGIRGSGTWTLQVSDLFSQDIGQVVSWDLLIKFEGDQPLTTRAQTSEARKHIVAAANVVGGAGTRFLTDIRIFNRGAADARVQAFFTPSGADGASTFSALALSIAPGQTLALDDAVKNDFKLSGVGSIEFRGDVANLLITSRTYNAATSSTYGQFVPAIETTEGVTGAEGAIHIPQLQNTAEFRTNVGFAELSGSGAIVELRVIDGFGVEIERREIPLSPFSQIQVPIAGGLGGTQNPRLRAEVRVVGGLSRVAAYGSVVDNETGDAIFVPAVKVPLENRQVRVLGTVRAPGANATRWRTDLWLFNRSEQSLNIALRFYPSNNAPQVAKLITLPPNGLTSIHDVVGTRFALDQAEGQLAIEATSLADAVITSRTWTEAGEGSYGQFIGGRRVSEAIGAGDRAIQMIQLENSTKFRTNIGVAEVSGAPARFRLRLYDSGGREIFSTDRDLVANQQIQLSLILSGAPAFTNGRASVEVIGGSGRILAYASVIDNLSGDPIFVPAR